MWNASPINKWICQYNVVFPYFQLVFRRYSYLILPWLTNLNISHVIFASYEPLLLFIAMILGPIAPAKHVKECVNVDFSQLISAKFWVHHLKMSLKWLNESVTSWILIHEARGAFLKFGWSVESWNILLSLQSNINIFSRLT